MLQITGIFARLKEANIQQKRPWKTSSTEPNLLTKDTENMSQYCTGLRKNMQILWKTITKLIVK
jgi:hypothetical protein